MVNVSPKLAILRCQKVLLCTAMMNKATRMFRSSGDKEGRKRAEFDCFGDVLDTVIDLIDCTGC